MKYLVMPLLFLSGVSFVRASHQEDERLESMPDITVTEAPNWVRRDVINYIDEFSPFLDPDRTNKVIVKLGDGLADTRLVEAKLKNHDYVSVLKCIWSEPDFNRRKQWLEAKVREGHPLLMIEYGKIIAYQTSIEEGAKWFYLGLFRAQQDAACCDCASFDIVNKLVEGEFFPKQWREVALDQWNKIGNDQFKKAANSNKEGLTATQCAEKAKQQALVELKNWKQFPSPQWIIYSSPPQWPGKPVVRLKAETEWPKIREQVIQELEQKLINEKKQKINDKKHTIGTQASLKFLYCAVCLGLGISISLYFLKRYFAKPAQ